MQRCAALLASYGSNISTQISPHYLKDPADRELVAVVNAADAALLQHEHAVVQQHLTATQAADEAYRCGVVTDRVRNRVSVLSIACCSACVQLRC